MGCKGKGVARGERRELDGTGALHAMCARVALDKCQTP